MMDNKRAILDELLANGRIYVDEKAEMIERNVQDYDEISESCFRCRRPLKEIYARPEGLTRGHNDYDLIVSKCEKCESYYAHWVPPFTIDVSVLDPAEEDEHLGGRIVQPPKWKYVGKPEWGEGKQPKFSRKKAKAYKESTLKQDNLAKKLDVLVQSKLGEMYRAELSIETINSARNKALKYMRKNRVTTKQLVALFAAACYEASHEELKMVGGTSREGEMVSERELEDVFEVTRKTIRKWRKRIPSRKTDFYL